MVALIINKSRTIAVLRQLLFQASFRKRMQGKSKNRGNSISQEQRLTSKSFVRMCIVEHNLEKEETAQDILG